MRDDGEVLLRLPLLLRPLNLGAVPPGRRLGDGVADDVARRVAEEDVAGLDGRQADRVVGHEDPDPAVIAYDIGREGRVRASMNVHSSISVAPNFVIGEKGARAVGNHEAVAATMVDSDSRGAFMRRGSYGEV